MAAFLRKYATGTGADVIIPMVKAGSVDHAVSADWTPAAGDVKVSKDGGAAANITTLPTYITSIGWKFVFSDTELTCARLSVQVTDSATKAVEDQHFEVETYGNASAQHAVDLDDSVRAGLTALPNAAADAAGGLPISDAGGLDLDAKIGALTFTVAGDVDVNVQSIAGSAVNTASAQLGVNVVNFGGSAGTFASGRPEVNATHFAGTAYATALAAEVDAVWNELSSGHSTPGSYGLELFYLYLQNIAATGTVNDAAATTTSFKTSLTDADNFWNDSVLTFTSGALSGQSRIISTFANTNGVITFDEALTSAPANGVTFQIKASHQHSKTQIAQAVLSEDATSFTTNSTLGAIVNDWEDGGRLDLILDDVPTTAEFQARTIAAASYGTAANQTTITTHLTDIKGATWSSTTDTLEAIRDRGDAAWITATGFSTLDAAGVRTAVGLASANLDTQLAALPTAAENATAVLTTQMTESYRGTGAAPTLAQSQFELIAHMGESSITSTTKTLKKIDGSTTAKTYTLDSSTTPTSITETT